ncbi:MAG TPA: NAD(P)-binding domain-containing protein [candidate division Zixibacteria bacterium]|nr:NAD(P)-binding domain-containing protein [candidate division Zixibacteria bacterium]
MEQILIWLGVAVLIGVIFIPYVRKFRRTHAIYAQRQEEAKAMGITRPRAQFPMINRSLCIGCGACVDACPEEDVLGVVWGSADVINGERCVGHGYCERVCPVGAIKIGLGDIKTRPDIPILTELNETTVPGIFIAGELGGLSLIRNAISQGRMVVDEIANRVGAPGASDVYHLVIVGAGPAGISAALTATQHNLSYLMLDEGEIGGTILKYPRRKLVMTQPVELPLYGWLKKDEYSKEFLVETWQDIRTRFELNVRSGLHVESVERVHNHFDIKAGDNSFSSRFVVLAMGRRGTPRKLEVPGEDLPKVMYQLIDAQSYTNQHMLVVGGGDSAVEAAVGLGKQPGNKVTISYRKSGFFRVKKKNEVAIHRLIADKKVFAEFDSQVAEIKPQSVVLQTKDGLKEIPNDFIIVQIGGIPPFEMLKQMGIAFGGETRPI